MFAARTGRRSWGVPTLWLAWFFWGLCGALQAEVPQIRTSTLSNLHDTDQGITKPTVADRNGHRYVLKANSRTLVTDRVAVKYGNFEAEIIAHAVFQLLGLDSPEVRVVALEGRTDLYLRIRYADASFTHGADAKPVNRTSIAEADPIDLDAVRKIALTDLLIGNADRHEGNILVYRTPAGVWMPIPIDHNFALVTAPVTEVQSWALTPIPAANASPRATVAYGDRFLTFTRGNRVTVQAVRGAEGHAALTALAARLQRELTDAALVRMVRSIPPEAVAVGEPDTRFAELIEVLTARRDAIPGFLERYFQAGGTP